MVFIFRVFGHHFGFAADWENWGKNARMPEGVFLSPSHWLGKLFSSPQLSTVFLIQDGGVCNRWEYPSRPAKIPLVLQAKYEEGLILVGGWGEGSRTPYTLPLDPPLNPVVFFARISEGCAKFFCWYFSIADNVFFSSDIIRSSFTSIYHWIDGRVNTLHHYGSYLHQILHMHFNLI